MKVTYLEYVLLTHSDTFFTSFNLIFLVTGLVEAIVEAISETIEELNEILTSKNDKSRKMSWQWLVLLNSKGKSTVL
jgi:hypothetical protein